MALVFDSKPEQAVDLVPTLPCPHASFRIRDVISTIIHCKSKGGRKSVFHVASFVKRYASDRRKEYYKSLMTGYREYFIPFLWNEK